MAKLSYTKYIELNEEMTDKVYVKPTDSGRLEVELNIVYWSYGYNSDLETEVESITVGSFYDKGLVVEVDIDDSMKEQIIALIDVKDSDFILELEESFYCGMDY